MGYKRTGNPPGRPRKDAAAFEEPMVAPPAPSEPMKRARAGFRRMGADLTSDLHRPPRFRNREVGRRPVLHPNVIKA